MLSAEIDWRLGNSQSAAERLNILRNRACKGHDHSIDITASEVTQDFLLDEYALSLIHILSKVKLLMRTMNL